MASLVADYGESSGESDGEAAESTPGTVGNEEDKPAINFFSGGGEDGASSEDSDTQEDANKAKTASKNSPDQPQQPKLPSPFMQGRSSKLPAPHLKSGKSNATQPSSLLSTGVTSVFVNPFEQAEQAKLGILEKHVRLTEAAPTKPASKQVCYKFRKSKCHLGDKCRFFHDRSNIPLGHAASGSNVETESHDSGPGFGRGDKSFQFPGQADWGGAERQQTSHVYHPAARYSRGQPAAPNVHDDDNYMKAAKGKKRYGVTDSLEPPKKALTLLADQRTKERPWTTKK